MFSSLLFAAIAIAQASASPAAVIKPGKEIQFQYAADPSQCVAIFDDDSPGFVLTSCATSAYANNFTLSAGSDAPGAISHASLDDDGEFFGAECLVWDGAHPEYGIGSLYCKNDDGGKDTLWTYRSDTQTIVSAEGGCWTSLGKAADNEVSVRKCKTGDATQKFTAVPIKK